MGYWLLQAERETPLLPLLLHVRVRTGCAGALLGRVPQPGHCCPLTDTISMALGEHTDGPASTQCTLALWPHNIHTLIIKPMGRL